MEVELGRIATVTATPTTRTQKPCIEPIFRLQDFRFDVFKLRLQVFQREIAENSLKHHGIMKEVQANMSTHRSTKLIGSRRKLDTTVGDDWILVVTGPIISRTLGERSGWAGSSRATSLLTGSSSATALVAGTHTGARRAGSRARRAGCRVAGRARAIELSKAWMILIEAWRRDPRARRRAAGHIAVYVDKISDESRHNAQIFE